MNTAPLASRRRPLTCVVTDRARAAGFGAAVSRGRLETGEADALRALVEAACLARIDLVQIREPDLPVRALSALVATCVEISRGTDTLVVVNERVDVALTAGADGAHLRASSFSVPSVRRIAPPGFVIGRSIHGAADCESGAGEGADYFLAGTVFATRSKPAGHRLLGTDGLLRVVRATSRPVLGIGGVSLENVPALGATGAAGLAAVDLFIAPGRPLIELLTQVRAAFTSAASSDTSSR